MAQGHLSSEHLRPKFGDAEDLDTRHLDTGLLADLLSGGIEGDDLRRRVIPHLLARCPVCRGRVAAIRRLQRDFDHWNESIVVRESREAPRQLAELLALAPDERLARLAKEESLHTWGLAQLALRRSRQRVFEDASAAVELAELAVAAAEELPGQAYHPDWVCDLTARAWAHLGNARRVLGELRSAEAALRRGRLLLERGSTGRPEVRAEVLDLIASLRVSQRRFTEAGELLDRVVALHRETGDSHRVGRTLIKKAKALEEAGEVEEAIELLSRAPSLLDPQREPRLPAYARHNLLCCLVAAERFAEARELLSKVRELFREAPEVDRLRLRWAEARIAHGLGETEAAEALYREVRDDLLAHQLALDAALVSLDLAVLYLEGDRLGDLEQVAAQMMPLFHCRDLHREAILALVLFQRAVEQRTLTVELLREMTALLRRRGRSATQPAKRARSV